MSGVGVTALLYSLISSPIHLFLHLSWFSFHLSSISVSYSVDVCRTFIVVSTPAVCNEGTANRLYPGSESGQRKPPTKTHRWRMRGEIKRWIPGGHCNLVLNNCYKIIRAPDISNAFRNKMIMIWIKFQRHFLQRAQSTISQHGRLHIPALHSMLVYLILGGKRTRRISVRIRKRPQIGNYTYMKQRGLIIRPFPSAVVWPPLTT